MKPCEYGLFYIFILERVFSELVALGVENSGCSLFGASAFRSETLQYVVPVGELTNGILTERNNSRGYELKLDLYMAFLVFLDLEPAGVYG